MPVENAGMSNHVEPEEQSRNPLNEDVTSDSFENPLTHENVNEKSYSAHNIKLNPGEEFMDIAEPVLNAGSLNQELPKQEEPKPQKPQDPKPFNQEFADMPKKDKEDASAKMANMLIDLYSFLNNKAEGLVKFNTKKLKRLHTKGEINLHLQIPVDDQGGTCTMKEYFEEYNRQQEGVFEVSEEFKNEVRPPLTKVLSKKGIGMTDEQQLMYLVAKDAGSKIFVGIQLGVTMNSMLKGLKEYSAEMRGNYSGQNSNINTAPPPPPPPPGPSNDTPPQESQQSYSQSHTVNQEIPVEQFTQPDFNNPDKTDGNGAGPGGTTNLEDVVVIMSNPNGEEANSIKNLLKKGKGRPALTAEQKAANKQKRDNELKNNSKNNIE